MSEFLVWIGMVWVWSIIVVLAMAAYSSTRYHSQEKVILILTVAQSDGFALRRGCLFVVGYYLAFLGGSLFALVFPVQFCCRFLSTAVGFLVSTLLFAAVLNGLGHHHPKCLGGVDYFTDAFVLMPLFRVGPPLVRYVHTHAQDTKDICQEVVVMFVLYP